MYSKAMEDQKHSLLIVEDEDHIREFLQSAFSKEGFMVMQAATGEEGLSHALDRHPSAILLDIMLPGMDGLTVLSKLRQDPWGKDVPVVLLTNLNPDDSMLEKINKDEPAFYLVKVNSSTEDIIAKVRAAIAHETE